MNCQFMFSAATIFAASLGPQISLPAQQKAPAVEKKAVAVNVRTLLEQGRDAGSLPPGLVIRVGSCLGLPKKQAAGDPLPPELCETWEFTADEVKRLKPEEASESRPFDSTDICRDLLKGKAIEIGAGQGTGPRLGFVGSNYEKGTRSIELVWKGEVILNLYETNGPSLELYRETDARAFGALHQQLTSKARELFKSNADDVK